MTSNTAHPSQFPSSKLTSTPSSLVGTPIKKPIPPTGEVFFSSQAFSVGVPDSSGQRVSSDIGTSGTPGGFIAASSLRGASCGVAASLACVPPVAPLTQIQPVPPAQFPGILTAVSPGPATGGVGGQQMLAHHLPSALDAQQQQHHPLPPQLLARTGTRPMTSSSAAPERVVVQQQLNQQQQQQQLYPPTQQQAVMQPSAIQQQQMVSPSPLNTNRPLPKVSPAVYKCMTGLNLSSWNVEFSELRTKYP